MSNEQRQDEVLLPPTAPTSMGDSTNNDNACPSTGWKMSAGCGMSVLSSATTSGRFRPCVSDFADSSLFHPLPFHTNSNASRFATISDAIDEALDVARVDTETGDASLFPGPSTSSAIDFAPTPIASRHRVSIVDEVKLGSTWNHTDGSTTQLLKQLFTSSSDVVDIDEDDHEPLPVNSSHEVDEVLSSSLPIFQQGEDSLSSSSTHSTSSIDSTKSVAMRDDAFHNPEKWSERYQELLSYRTEFGHCLVPHNWSRNRALAQWVKRQRYQFKLKKEGRHTTLTNERMNALESIGFVWSSHCATWEEKFNELIEFANRNGHCNVPSRYPPNRQLSVWVRCQRRHFKLLKQQYGSYECNKLAKERYNKLKSLGFDFNPRKLKI